MAANAKFSLNLVCSAHVGITEEGDVEFVMFDDDSGRNSIP